VTRPARSTLLTSCLFTSIFGSNFTAVVGLTNWMYAVTDGYQAVYQGGDRCGLCRILRWPHEMNPAFGVAAVSFAGMSTLVQAPSLQATRRLPCRQQTYSPATATDTEQGIVILCSILPSSGIPPRADRLGLPLAGVLPRPLRCRADWLLFHGDHIGPLQQVSCQQVRDKIGHSGQQHGESARGGLCNQGNLQEDWTRSSTSRPTARMARDAHPPASPSAWLRARQAAPTTTCSLSQQRSGGWEIPFYSRTVPCQILALIRSPARSPRCATRAASPPSPTWTQESSQPAPNLQPVNLPPTS